MKSRHATRIMPRAACCVWLVVLAASTVAVAAAFPKPTGYVNDFAGVLAADQKAYLEDYLRKLEQDTSAEVAIATVESLDGMSVEEYAVRLFAEWGIGKKREDNGVLLLVATRDRKVRIEVGYGLEPILPDGLAGEIIRDQILPEFRAGNLPRGIGRGVDRINQIVRRQPAAAPQSSGAPSAARSVVPAFGGVLFFGLFFGAFVAVAGLIAFTLWIGLRKGAPPSWMRTQRSGSSQRTRDATDAWTAGRAASSSDSGSSDNSSSSSSSSSSDFGGGSSGGGGASGSW